jgi:hypothetical protein
MRYLPRFLTEWFRIIPSEHGTSWTRETPWRQGSTIPSERAVRLGLLDQAHCSTSIAIVASHDCDLANGIEDEPTVEVLVGTPLESCDANRTYAKNVRVLHIELDGPTGRKAFEIHAHSKRSVAKRRMTGFGPDDAYSLRGDDLDIFRAWLAARYKRASIPDGLQALIKDTFEQAAKKKERPHALRGIWIDFEPDSDKLPTGEKYELWVSVVYSTSEEGSKDVAEETANQIETKFKTKYCKEGVWTGIDLRECVARSDTEFTLYDTFRYKLFRLEHLSIRAGAPLEVGE